MVINSVVAVTAPPPNRLVIIGLSARILAQSARRGKFETAVIDQFTDSDTQALADHTFRLNLNELVNRKHDLISIVNNILAIDNWHGLIFGSGIDHQFGIVDLLRRNFSVFGNSVETLKACYEPENWFRLLSRLNIPFPETRFSAPEKRTGWLVKVSNSEGGTGIRRLEKCEHRTTSIYFQQYIPGKSVSALFWANGKTGQIIGLNTQTVDDRNDERPFLFEGLINRACVSSRQHKKIGDWINMLVEALGLRGLNSIDMIVNDLDCYVTELNPRPSASVGLYDEDYEHGLVAAHIEAFADKPLFSPEKSTVIRAIRTIFAPTSLTIPDPFSWPDWCVDRPIPGTKFLSGQALCSIIASGNSQEHVESLIETRKIAMDRWLAGLTHKIY